MRRYLLKYENLLREIDCRVTLPYWDWSLFPGAVWSQGEDEIWSSKPWGLGGNGQKGRGPGCVNEGRFKRKTWRVTPSARRDCLRRSFGGIMILLQCILLHVMSSSNAPRVAIQHANYNW